ncbi:unnamed protein product [Mytilus coruscus]|uniref:C-type lectin domain-containing protein n=1 Tax=Mytilus coruscus TaxID=42192 RepID=A0A6J8DV71_MYTCO|nr:unnamed protein product [Mytilus coruscus]
MTIFDFPQEECKCLGGYLAEIETAEENDFIKNITRERYEATGDLLSAISQEVINVKFEIELNRKITENENTTDIYQKTLLGCTRLCFHDKKRKHQHVDLILQSNVVLLPKKVTPRTSFAIAFIEECNCRGGFLAEIESAEENALIKNIAKERFAATGAIHYLLGAYTFNQDSDMEWIRNPRKPMPFTDWYGGEPNKLRYEFCLALYKPVDYLWIDYECPEAISFI